jgi:hypothetical protein
MLQFRGLLAYRELDNTLGLTDTGADTLADACTGKNSCSVPLCDKNGPFVTSGLDDLQAVPHRARRPVSFPPALLSAIVAISRR